MIKRLIRGATLLVGLLLFSNLQASTDVALGLAQIPRRDKEILDRFFQCLLKEYPLGYTLFGNKPISVADYPSLSIGGLSNDSVHFVLEIGWETWVRYRDLFLTNEFALLKKRRTDDHFTVDSIWLVHNKNTLKAIRDNLDLFQKTLGKLEPEEILLKLYESDHLLDMLSNELSGILFGYGRENAIAFHENPITFRLCARPGKPESFELPGNDYNLEHMNLPGFVCWNRKDELLESYTQTRKKFRKIYSNRNFLEVTLEQWTDPK